jgi:hypothetical protein
MLNLPTTTAFFTPLYNQCPAESRQLTLLYIRIPHGCWMKLRLHVLYTDIAGNPHDPARFIPFGAAIPVGPDEAMTVAGWLDAIDGTELLRHITRQITVLEQFYLDGLHPDAPAVWRENREDELAL